MGENARHNRLASQGGCFVILHSYIHVCTHRPPPSSTADRPARVRVWAHGSAAATSHAVLVVLVAIAATDSVPMFAPLVVPFKLERVRLAEGSLFEQKQCEL